MIQSLEMEKKYPFLVFDDDEKTSHFRLINDFYDMKSFPVVREETKPFIAFLPASFLPRRRPAATEDSVQTNSAMRRRSAV